MIARTHRLVLALALAAAPLCAQAKAAKSASTRLHAAWLREIVDLDVPGAVAEYRAIAADFPTAPERWVAIARLEELRRVGVRVEPPVPAANAPQEVKRGLARLTPLPMGAEDLQRQALAGPVLYGESLETPPSLELRPASQAAQFWVNRVSGPTWSEQQAQRFRSGAQARPGGARDERFRLVVALDILNYELDGRTQYARNLRDNFFQNWKEPTPKGDPAALLARARGNLEAWLKDSLTETQQTRLNRLLEELKNPLNPAATLATLQRVPVVGERLLAEPPAGK